MNKINGDNFDMVYADGAWVCDDVPERIMALVLMALMVGRSL